MCNDITICSDVCILVKHYVDEYVRSLSRANVFREKHGQGANSYIFHTYLTYTFSFQIRSLEQTQNIFPTIYECTEILRGSVFIQMTSDFPVSTQLMIRDLTF